MLVKGWQLLISIFPKPTNKTKLVFSYAKPKKTKFQMHLHWYGHDLIQSSNEITLSLTTEWQHENVSGHSIMTMKKPYPVQTQPRSRQSDPGPSWRRAASGRARRERRPQRCWRHWAWRWSRTAQASCRTWRADTAECRQSQRPLLRKKGDKLGS